MERAGFVPSRSLIVGGMTIVKWTDAVAEQRILSQADAPACTGEEIAPKLPTPRDNATANIRRRIDCPCRA